MTINQLVTSRLEDGRGYNHHGQDVMAEDWDTLFILDSCRYDLFEELNEFSGRLEHRMSRGAATVEFLRGNFTNRTLPDTVYVSANPQILRRQEDLGVEFHDVVPVWETGWKSDEQTVPPEKMTEAARDAVNKYPEKRLILHYNQPHGPMLGQTGRRLAIGPNRKPNENLLEFVVDQIKHGMVGDRDYWKAYRENYHLVQDSVMELLPNIDGKTVITSDHGRLMGERGLPVPVKYYGHHIGERQPPSLKVPWLIHEQGERREISEGETETQSLDSGQDVTERLRDLGYVD